MASFVLRDSWPSTKPCHAKVMRTIKLGCSWFSMGFLKTWFPSAIALKIQHNLMAYDHGSGFSWATAGPQSPQVSAWALWWFPPTRVPSDLLTVHSHTQQGMLAPLQQSKHGKILRNSLFWSKTWMVSDFMVTTNPKKSRIPCISFPTSMEWPWPWTPFLGSKSHSSGVWRRPVCPSGICCEAQRRSSPREPGARTNWGLLHTGF